MSEKTKKILEEIKLGTRNNMYDIEVTPEEYLEKDENGVSFLEHLFENNIPINYKDSEKFKNNVEIGHIYCKLGQSLYLFDFTEEQLFSNVNGKLFVQFLADKGKLSKKMIGNVKSNINLVDIIISTNDSYNLNYLSDELVKKLTIKYPNGLYPIEKYLINEKFYKHLLALVKDYEILNEICTKYNKTEWLKYANTDVLMHKITENEFVINKLLNNYNIIPELLERLPNDKDFINFLRENNFYEYLTTTSEDIFLLKINSDKTLLEDLLEKEYKIKFTGFIWEPETIKLLKNSGKLEIVNEAKILDSVLLRPSKDVLKEEDEYNRTLLEYLLDNGYEPLKKSTCTSNPEIINILYNKGYYKLLGEKLTEKELLIEIEPGILIVDKLLDNDININVDNISSFDLIELAKKLCEKNRFDLLVVGDINMLLNNYDLNNTYFDYVLEAIKSRKVKYSLTKYKCSDELVAKFYILVAKHDMMKYVDELEEETLLKKYNEKTLLEELLDLDVDLTLNKILTEKLKSKPKVSIILKSRGIEQKNVDIITNKSNFTKEYLDNINPTFGIGPLRPEGEILLKQIEDLFLNDGNSSPELIFALISGYRDALINNYEVTIHELINLVEVKKQNIDKFFYIKEEETGYFNIWSGSIYCEDATISTLMHETGHALHYYLSNNKIPEKYNEVVERIRQNPQTINKVEDYSKKFNELRDKIKKSIEQKCEEYFTYYFDEQEEDIIEFLNSSKEKQKEEFKDLGISEESLDLILDGVFTKEEYIEHQKRRYIKEKVEAIFRSEFSAYIAIGDIIDAVYDGDFHSGLLKNEKGEKIESAFGHGLAYYFASLHGFDEMIANFCMIQKSKDFNQILDLLKDTLGNELYDMLNEFYHENILNPNADELEDKKIL